jgi:hypothetical protein
MQDPWCEYTLASEMSNYNNERTMTSETLLLVQNFSSTMGSQKTLEVSSSTRVPGRSVADNPSRTTFSDSLGTTSSEGPFIGLMAKPSECKRFTRNFYMPSFFNIRNMSSLFRLYLVGLTGAFTKKETDSDISSTHFFVPRGNPALVKGSGVSVVWRSHQSGAV